MEAGSTANDNVMAIKTRYWWLPVLVAGGLALAILGFLLAGNQARAATPPYLFGSPAYQVQKLSDGRYTAAITATLNLLGTSAPTPAPG